MHHRIFPPQSTFEKGVWSYAFHYGGRSELQFNVGFEDEGKSLRHGLAFSFERNRNLTDLGLLSESVLRFNEFLKTYPEYVTRFSMWHYEERRGRTPSHAPTPISNDLFHWGIFVVLGNVQSTAGTIDYELILDDFDHLLPLYEFVEGKGGFPLLTPQQVGFKFEPGCSIKTFSTRSSVEKHELDIDLRHKRIQLALYRYLSSIHGSENVKTECGNAGVLVDLVVRAAEKYWFYEVKTSSSARGCIREALAQLLEYSFWPGSQEAEKLIVIGEPPLDPYADQYLLLLKTRFSLPIEYQQFDLQTCKPARTPRR